MSFLFSGYKCLGVGVIITVQLHSSKPKFRFCSGSNLIGGVSLIRDDENFRQDLTPFVGHHFAKTFSITRLIPRKLLIYFWYLKFHPLRSKTYCDTAFRSHANGFAGHDAIFFMQHFVLFRRVRTITFPSSMFLMNDDPNLWPVFLMKISSKASLLLLNSSVNWMALFRSWE